MTAQYEVTAGSAHTLGVCVERDGTNVAVWAPHASSVTLCLHGSDEDPTRIALPTRTNGVWHGKVTGVGHGAEYTVEIGGPDEAVVQVLDPYARAVTVTESGAGPSGLRGVVVDDEFDWRGDAAPRVPWNETVVYEAHVRGLTMLHPEVPDELRGTYAGLAHPVVLDHLVRLGVTAVELLPVHEFITEPTLRDDGRVNYWGYNSAAFFAPHGAYSASGTHGEQVTEFKQLVCALHERGIEVLLDVVYNHTCEGNEQGPLVNLRGLDDDAYYRHADGNYLDITGCGNTVRADQPTTSRLILDSLRYWVTQLHVDGFRFDLASALARGESHEIDLPASVIRAIGDDPVLSSVKLIAEPWDASMDGYLLGGFPTQWSEWNDRYRDGVRDFWRGTPGGVRDLAARLSGSADLFEPSGRGPQASINFVTAHDGFTLRDTVSYDEKHNEANGEDNADGHNDNRSWNCGVEGETDDPAVLAVRHRQAANLMATLLLSAGVPMVSGGDEWGRTQHGNNNAYCQDNELSWSPWRADPGWEHLLPLLTELIRLRAQHPAYRGDAHRHGDDTLGTGRRDIAWLHPHGREMTDDDWFDLGLNSLGMFLDGGPDHPALLALMHAGAEPVEWALPDTSWSRTYETVIDTATGEGGKPHQPGDRITLPDHSMVVLLGT
ncbi:MAG: glycogen debranching protein GlgX [Nocardioidaceae bacterium]